ncbi:MAG: transcriptional regulator, partial [Methylobacteriaceae bacterium]|nr:transcriptional regulator [Methylobacteriaceae bacterium]
RISKGLLLSEPEREHLYMLALGHPPDVRYRPVEAVSPRIQRILDALEICPAIVKTSTWDVVAWNAAAAAVLSDYAALPPGERNALRRMFSAPDVRRTVLDWEENARMILATFRLDVARSGGCPQAGLLADELAATSADFRRLWADNDLSRHASGTKRLHHPIAGPLALEYAAFPIAEAEGLTMVVFNPVSTADRRAIEGLVAHEAAAA